MDATKVDPDKPQNQSGLLRFFIAQKSGVTRIFNLIIKTIARICYF